MGAREFDESGHDVPPRKPLYLATRTRVRVCSAAESLVVRGRRTPERQFPIARVDRVVCNDLVDWAGSALALCLNRGVTLTWVSARGDVLGECAPRLNRPCSLHHALESFLARPDWVTTYESWLRERRNAVVVSWAKRRAAGRLPVARGEWEMLKREFIYKGRVIASLPEIVHAWCLSQVVARLATSGVCGRYHGYDGHFVDLAGDLTSLLWAAVNLDAGTLMRAGTDGRTLALAFEAAKAERDNALRDHLAHLNRAVVQAISSWR